MKKYLMGKTDDLTGEYEMYPLVFCDEISRDDLLRVKRDKIVIINLIEGTFYNADKNQWDKLLEFNKYSDQWKTK